MPTYDYECARGHNFEQLQPITADPLEECPQCGSSVRRLIGGGAGIIFKGSGFYVTDSKGKSGGAAKSKAADKGKTEKAASDGAAKGGGESTKSSTDAPAKKPEKAVAT